MKRLFVMMSCAVLLSACATRNKPMAPWVQPTKAVQAQPQVDANGYAIEAIPFRAGVSSATVEKLAQAQGCTGGQGAGLTTPQGPVEIYRMICDGGHVFMARCELRQCRATSTPPAGGYRVLQVPADSNVYIATEKGTRMLRQGAMGPKQVPSLAIDWQCGDCFKNPRVATLILAGYTRQAYQQGYTVSNAETATVTIVDISKRPVAARIAFGRLSGKDRLGAKINFRGQNFDVESESMKGYSGIDSVSQQLGQRAFTQLRPATN